MKLIFVLAIILLSVSLVSSHRFRGREGRDGERRGPHHRRQAPSERFPGYGNDENREKFQGPSEHRGFGRHGPRGSFRHRGGETEESNESQRLEGPREGGFRGFGNGPRFGGHHRGERGQEGEGHERRDFEGHHGHHGEGRRRNHEGGERREFEGHHGHGPRRDHEGHGPRREHESHHEKHEGEGERREGGHHGHGSRRDHEGHGPRREEEGHGPRRDHEGHHGSHGEGRRGNHEGRGHHQERRVDRNQDGGKTENFPKKSEDFINKRV